MLATHTHTTNSRSPSMSTTHRKPIIQLSTCSCLRLFMSFVLFVRKINFHRYILKHRIRTLTHVCSNLTTTLNIKLSLEEYESSSNQPSATQRTTNSQTTHKRAMLNIQRSFLTTTNTATVYRRRIGVRHFELNVI